MWLSVAKLAELLNISERAVRKQIAANRYVSARYVDSSQGGNSGRTWEISAYDQAVPPFVRKALGMEEAKEDLNPDIVLAGRTKLCIPPEKLGDPYTAKRMRAVFRALDAPREVDRSVWYEQVALEENISLSTLYRWLRESSEGKVSRKNNDKSVALSVEAGPLKFEFYSRTFSEEAIQHGLALLHDNPRMDVRQAYIQTVAVAEQNGWRVGGERSFYRVVNQRPETLKILAVAGRRGLEAIIKPPIERDMSFVSVYDILIGDQHIFDYTVFDDDREPIRPQMFAWEDAKSRFFSGISLVMGSYDKYAVGFALREACRWGIPRNLYNDWGKPENSKYVEQLRRQLAGSTIFHQGNEELPAILPQINAKPRNAQAKAIESHFYHALEGPLKQRNLPGYSRRDVDEKVNAMIQENLRKDIKQGRLLYAKDFFEIVLETFAAWNKHTMTVDKTIPEEIFREGISSQALPYMDDKTLDFAFLPAEKRVVRNSYIEISLPHLGRCRWVASELSKLCSRGRKTLVEVRYDPYDISKVYVLDLESHEYICTAESWGKTNPYDKDAVSQKIRRQNQLGKWFQEALRQMSTPTRKVIQMSPYKKAAAEIVDVEQLRESFAVNNVDLERHIRELGRELDRKHALERAASEN